MDANFLLGVATVATMGVGIWGLVFRRNGNGNHHAPESEAMPPPELPPSTQLVEDLQLAQLREATQSLAHIPVLLEKIFRQAADQPRELEIPPEWAARMLGDLEAIEERLHEPPAPNYDLEKMTASLNRLTDRVEALLQLPPPRVELAELAQPLAQLPEELEKKFDRLARQIGVLLRAPQGSLPASGARRAPPTHASGPIYLEMFNTLYLDEHTIYELIPPEPDIYDLSVMNIGPGVIFMRALVEPEDYDDPKSTTIPAGTGDNYIHLPQRLFILVDDDGAKVSARLSYGN